MPDLNSLPHSPAASPLHLRTTMTPNDTSNTSSPARGIHTPDSPQQQSQSPSSTAAHSLAAAATLNAGLANEARDASRLSSSNGLNPGCPPSAGRRRSSIRMNLHINDPGLPGPGELAMSPGGRRASHGASGTWPGSPSGHQRAPSLGELHQELENEQEAQVNRLLSMIRQQQSQIQALQNQSAATPIPNNSAIAIDDGTPTSERSMSLNQPAAASQQNVAPRPRSPFHPPHSLSRHSSYRSGRSSHEGSPSIRPMSGSYGLQNETGSSEFLLSSSSAASRDESAFYQAETQMLTRENQMLKLRIRELERQLNDMNPTSPITHSPAMTSNLHRPPMNVQEAEAASLPAPAQGSSSGEAMDTS